MKLDNYFDDANGIIISRPEGGIINENIKLTIKKAMELSQNKSCTKILFDITRCGDPQPLLHGYEQMKSGLMSGGLTLNHICAVVYNPVTYPEDRANFIENVVANRMNPRFKMFKDESEAVKWLRNSD